VSRKPLSIALEEIEAGKIVKADLPAEPEAEDGEAALLAAVTDEANDLSEPTDAG
jgi:hypothetical protein